MRRHSGIAAPQPPAVLAEPGADAAGGEPIVMRPDGYHWLASGGRQEFGPFETIEAARAAMALDDAPGATAPGEMLHEAESDIGIADWIDPQTGEPAEGQSPPHLEEE